MKSPVSLSHTPLFSRPAPNTPSTIVIDKVAAGWRVNLGGQLSHFGTRFMAIETATGVARKALAAGRRITVLIRKSDGAWQTAWTPDDPYLA